MSWWQWRMAVVGVLAVVSLGLWLSWAGCRSVRDESVSAREDAGAGPDGSEQTSRAEHLEKLQRVVNWAINERAALLSDLLAGRSTLFETAAGFRDIQLVKDRCGRVVSLPFPGRTEEEQLCRQVIAYVETQILEEPEGPATVARLKKELQEHLERYGTVRLPASPRLDAPRF
jgi:hypothetical protein